MGFITHNLITKTLWCIGNQLKKMTNSKLFQYAILWHPTEKQAKDEGLKSKVIVEPKTILANAQDNAAMAAAMEIPAEYKTQLDQIEVVLRPF